MCCYVCVLMCVLMTLCPFSRSTGTTVKPVEEQLGSGLLNFTATNSTLDPGVCVWGCVFVCVGVCTMLCA